MCATTRGRAKPFHTVFSSRIARKFRAETAAWFPAPGRAVTVQFRIVSVSGSFASPWMLSGPATPSNVQFSNVIELSDRLQHHRCFPSKSSENTRSGFVNVQFRMRMLPGGRRITARKSQ